jgi:hypothetical protein
MRRIALISIALLLCSVAARAQDLVVHHELDVRVDPATSRVDVTDTISIPVTMQLEDLAFSLHEGLSPQSVTEGTSIAEAGGTGSAADKGMDQEDYSSVFRRGVRDLHDDRAYAGRLEDRQPGQTQQQLG